MKRLFTLDKLANWTLLVASLLVIAKVGVHFYGAHGLSASNPQPSVTYAPGEVFGVNEWRPRQPLGQTVIVYIRSSCSFCTASMPLYRTLAQLAIAVDSEFDFIVASSEQPEVTRGYLAQNGVPLAQVIQVAANDMLPGTPLLFVLQNRDTRVKSVWRGYLQEPRQKELLQSLTTRQ